VRRLALAALCVAGCAPATREPVPLPAGKVFAQNPNLPPGGEFVVIAGSPTATGPYAFRVRFAPGLKVMPHTHPDDRLYTVLSGVWTIGVGAHYDESMLQRFGPGEVYVLPAGTPHFHGAPEGVTTFQVSGIGPTATVYIRSEDDPRNR
jgi:quercetin dioxygenase-like cupin family protein